MPKTNQDAQTLSRNGHQGSPAYPGVPTTSDGSGTVVWVDTHITQGACAYPITSSTTMGAGYGQAVANGRENLWGDELMFMEPESEHSAATACEGFALAGGRVSNFTSGQGLVLMKEVLYTITGKRLPVVFHIGARALTSQSLNVHAGHDDVMSVADTGWGMLFARNAQGAGDLALISRRAAEDSKTPFFAVQDGFLTTHTVEDVLLPEPEMMKEFIGDPRDKLINLFDPDNPVMTGVVQNQDSYMKGKIAQRIYYDDVPRHHSDSHGRVLRADRASLQHGRQLSHGRCRVRHRRHGLLHGDGPGHRRLDSREDGHQAGRRPCDLLSPLPRRTDRRDAQGRQGVHGAGAHGRSHGPEQPADHRHQGRLCRCPDRPRRAIPPSTACRPSSAAPPGWAAAMCVPATSSPCPTTWSRTASASLSSASSTSWRWKCAIDPDVRPKGAFSMRGHSVGGYGSVTTNKVIATIAGDVFGKKVQAYPKYGSEKKGLPTTYYLTVANEPILTHCELNQVDFVPMNDINAFVTSNPLSGIAVGGAVFVQSNRTTPEEVWSRIPPHAKRIIREKKIRVFAADAALIAREEAPVADLEVRMQGIVLLGIFLKVTPFDEESRLLHRRGDGTGGKGAAQVLRQAWRGRRAGQPAGRPARLRLGLRDPGRRHRSRHQRRHFRARREVGTVCIGRGLVIGEW